MRPFYFNFTLFLCDVTKIPVFPLADLLFHFPSFLFSALGSKSTDNRENLDNKSYSIMKVERIVGFLAAIVVHHSSAGEFWRFDLILRKKNEKDADENKVSI